jgi:hypothetical protein
MLEPGKAAGPDGITPETLKGALDDECVHMRQAMLQLFDTIISSGVWPAEWRHGVIVLIPKPGADKTDANSYRGISLLSVLSKL